jgi:hypothetical protein
LLREVRHLRGKKLGSDELGNSK